MIAQQYIEQISLRVKRIPDYSELAASFEYILKVAAVVMVVVVFIFGGIRTAGSFFDKQGTQQLRVTVKEGDTLWKFAEKYGRKDRYILSRLDEIARLNNITPSKPIQPGTEILIPR